MDANPADLLRRHGIQVTAQRLAVLRAVSARPHITADAVAEAVRGDIGAIYGVVVHQVHWIARGIRPNRRDERVRV